MSATLSTARSPAVELPINVQADVSSVVNARALPQIAPPVASTNTVNNIDVSLARARQHGGVDGLSGNGQTNRLGNEAAAQRAVMEYNNVAMQEQRFELTGVLAGIDVFA